MDGAGDQFFSRAALAGDQDGARGRRHGPHHLQDGLDFLAVADNIVLGEDAQQFAAQPDVLLAQRQFFQGPLHHQAQFLHQLVRLDHVTVRAQVQGLNGGGHRGNRGDQDERRRVA